MNSPVSRRDLLLNPIRRLRSATTAAQHTLAASTQSMPTEIDTPATALPQVAVIMGRQCLAYRHLACSICQEQCPEDGAIVTERGIPRVVADRCTGCGVCHDVCPAPTNAVLMLKRKAEPARKDSRP